MSPLVHFLRKMLGMGAEVAKDVIVEQIEKRAGQKMPRPITPADLRRRADDEPVTRRTSRPPKTGGSH